MNTNSLLLFFFHHYLEEHQFKSAKVIHDPQQFSQMMDELNQYAMLAAVLTQTVYWPNNPATVKERLITLLEKH